MALGITVAVSSRLRIGIDIGVESELDPAQRWWPLRPTKTTFRQTKPKTPARNAERGVYVYTYFTWNRLGDPPYCLFVQVI